MSRLLGRSSVGTSNAVRAHQRALMAYSAPSCTDPLNLPCPAWPGTLSTINLCTACIFTRHETKHHKTLSQPTRLNTNWDACTDSSPPHVNIPSNKMEGLAGNTRSAASTAGGAKACAILSRHRHSLPHCLRVKRLGTKRKGPSSGGKSVGCSGSSSELEGCRMPCQAASVACTDPRTELSCSGGSSSGKAQQQS